MNKKLFSLFFIIVFLFSVLPFNFVFAASQAAEYLSSLGVVSYQLGRYEDALSEFNKVLLIDPGNDTAKEYINDIFLKQNPAPGAIVPQRENNPVKITAANQEAVYELQESINREDVIDSAMDKISGQGPSLKKSGESKLTKENQTEFGKFNVTGEIQARLGITSEDLYWKRANWDLNEKNFHQLSNMAIDRTINSYDPRIYDRLRVNLDSGKDLGLNFHSNITIDPWSFTGRTSKIDLRGVGGDFSQVEIKYWSNTGYTVNQRVNTISGDSFNLPEIKVVNGRTTPTTVTSGFGNIYNIPETKIEREFQPLREMWLDYNQDNLKFRVYPMGYENQAISFDDPLKLSNNHIWWEDSPWIHAWAPGQFNSGAAPVDFTPGYWDNSMSFFARDSEGRRLTALRGFAFDFNPLEKTKISTSVATPKSLWQDYSEVDNYLSATRLNQTITDNLSLGVTATTRIGYNTDDKNKLDAQNFVLGTDLRYELMEGIMASMEIAASNSSYDLSNSTYKSKARGNAYYFSIIGRFPQANIIDTQYGYDGILPTKDEQNFTKFRFFLSRMDESFDEPLSSYVETRDDEYWSRHIHFRKPFKYYFQGEGQTLSWDDIKNYRIGNGIDYGRSTIGLRVESLLWDKKVDNLFDVRNVHDTDGKFVENVVREELTWQATDKLTAKVLGIYNQLPSTHAGTDPFIFDPLTRRYFDNTYIGDNLDPTLGTGSLGLNYDFFDWLGLDGIWEYTNDISLGYDNFPRGLFNAANRSVISHQYDNTYRTLRNFLYGQDNFPAPPYPYYNIFKTGLRLTPAENLEFYLDYARNPYEKAGPIDDNMNHVGLSVSYSPIPKLSFFFRYAYSRWQDIDKLLYGDCKLYGHHNVFTELIYRMSEDQDFTFQYGEGSRDPYMGGVLDIGWDPYGGDLRTVDTQHIFRLYYRRKF